MPEITIHNPDALGKPLGQYSQITRVKAIAVGTLITERPPHRTERAPFGHSAPTSGV